MSKIGKRAILILLALPIGFNVMAQEIKKPDTGRLDSGRRDLPLCRKPLRSAMVGETCVSNQVPTPSTLFNPEQGKRQC